MQRSPGGPRFLRSEPYLVLGFVLGAVLVRSPAMLYSALNYDESMYLLMGSEFARGHLPYTTICDLKPFGLFALATPVAASPFDPVFTARIVSSIVVGLTAWMLSQIARQLFGPGGRAIGIVAGLSYIVFSVATGGLAFQGELFQNAVSVLGLLLLLRAIGRCVPPSAAAMCVVGLVLGTGVQIKQSTLFDMLAFLAGFSILVVPLSRESGVRLRTSLKPLLVLGASSLLPTLSVVALYAAAGHLDAWTTANIDAHRVFYGRDRGFALEPAFEMAWEQLPLWLTAATALVLAPGLALDPRECRAVAFLGVWWAAVAACIAFLRISADHYFLQFLPPLCLLTGLAVGRGVLARIPDRHAAGAVLVALASLTMFAVARYPILHAILMLNDRFGGERWAGDTPRRIAADLKPLLQRGDTIYVVGFQPAVYLLTGAMIPTRFAFTGLPHFQVPGRDGCPWVEPAVEMRRVMERRPRFVVVERNIFLAEMRSDVRQILDEHLAYSYRLRKRVEEHRLHYYYPFERFIMDGGKAADVYELSGG
jgi:hypothetical protein